MLQCHFYTAGLAVYITLDLIHMNSGAKVILVGVGGLFAGWFLLFVFCSIPIVANSNACGHNAAMWFPVSYLLGVGVCWLVLSKVLARRSARRQEGK